MADRSGERKAFVLSVQLERALEAGGRTIVELRTDRAANVALHRRVWRAVRDAV